MINKEKFLIERYKYILSRKQSLNETTFKIAAIYQVIIIALAASQYNVVTLLKSKVLDKNIAIFFSNCLIVMLTILTSLTITLLVGGIFSWLKYRHEESLIESEAFGTSREKPKVFNILRWYETYLVTIVLLIFFLALGAYFKVLYPTLIS